MFYFFKKEQTEKAKQSEARLRGLTKQALVKLSSSIAIWKCFFSWKVGRVQLTHFPSLVVNASFQQFSVCYVSASVLHNLECPLIPCLIVLGLFIFQNPGLFRCQLLCEAFPHPPDHGLYTCKHFCVSCMHWSCSPCLFVWLDSALEPLLSDRFMLVYFLVTVFNNFGRRETKRDFTPSSSSVYCG